MPGTHSKVRPVVVREADCALEQWDDVSRGTVRWRTLFSGDRTPTRALTCGVAELPPPRTGEPSGLHSHEPAELYYILEGAGVLTIDGVDHPVSAGSAAFIPGNAVHGLRNTGTTPLRLLYTFAVDSFDQVEYRFPTPSEG
jgi:mannose-6-phosphate isomerase-like protein (cupin superfamily)